MEPLVLKAILEGTDNGMTAAEIWRDLLKVWAKSGRTFKVPSLRAIQQRRSEHLACKLDRKRQEVEARERERLVRVTTQEEFLSDHLPPAEPLGNYVDWLEAKLRAQAGDEDAVTSLDNAIQAQATAASADFNARNDATCAMLVDLIHQLTESLQDQ
jgi:hypothetical protein